MEVVFHRHRRKYVCRKGCGKEDINLWQIILFQKISITKPKKDAICYALLLYAMQSGTLQPMGKPGGQGQACRNMNTLPLDSQGNDERILLQLVGGQRIQREHAIGYKINGSISHFWEQASFDKFSITSENNAEDVTDNLTHPQELPFVVENVHQLNEEEWKSMSRK